MRPQSMLQAATMTRSPTRVKFLNLLCPAGKETFISKKTNNRMQTNLMMTNLRNDTQKKRLDLYYHSFVKQIFFRK